MEKDELIKKINKEGSYQDIEIDGELVNQGWRECQKRWEFLKPHFNKGNVVMDIGSHYGYFSVKIAREIPNSIVWSVEGNEDRAEIQKEVIIKNKLTNIAFCQHKLRLLDFLKLSRVVEGIDVIMALSVFHYFDTEELVEILGLCSRIAPKLIIEFPNTNEGNVAEKERVKKVPDTKLLLSGFYEKIQILGEAESPASKGVKRTTYLAQNTRIDKVHLNSYLSRQTVKKHKLVYKEDEWWFKNDNWIKGLNLGNLFEFNLIYPDKDYILDKVSDCYLNLIKTIGAVSDMTYRNVIFAADGFKIIDFSEGLGNDLYGIDWQEYKKGIEKMTKEDLLNHFKLHGLN